MPHTPFAGSVPDDRLYCPAHDLWVQPVAEGEVMVGISSFGLFLAGEILAFTAKPKGATVDRGRGLGTVECRKTVLAVHAPLSFILLDANEVAEEKPGSINRDPYGAGWLVRARPTDWVVDREHLVDAAAYRRHILNIEPEASLV